MDRKNDDRRRREELYSCGYGRSDVAVPLPSERTSDAHLTLKQRMELKIKMTHSFLSITAVTGKRRAICQYRSHLPPSRVTGNQSF